MQRKLKDGILPRGSLIAGIALACLAFGGAAPATASVSATEARPAMVIGDDYGGEILTRIHEIRDIRRQARAVRITGSVCYSSCTMLIGLKTACVSPHTTFGFHGPSRHGQRLSKTDFDRASRIIAAHYPPALRDWYLTTARHEIDDVLRLSGADLIAAGVRAC